MSLGSTHIQEKLSVLLDQFGDLRNWVRQAAALNSNRESLHESIYLRRASTGRVVLCRYKTVSCAPLFAGSWEKPLLFRSLSAVSHRACGCSHIVFACVCLLEGTMALLSWGERKVVAELSHPAFCTARELAARAALLGGMLWMWSRVSPFDSSVFTWKCSRTFVLSSFLRLLPQAS